VAKPEERTVFQATFGVVSFGTPQLYPGNKLLIEFIDRLCQLPDELNPAPRTYQFEDYKSGTWKEDVKFLHKRLDCYKTIAIKIPEIFCFETEPLDGFGFIAKKEIAVLKARALRHEHCADISMRSHHVDMAKFTKDRSDFADLCEHIIRLYDGSQLLLEQRRSKTIEPLSALNCSTAFPPMTN
jgi:hypothetical protein